MCPPRRDHTPPNRAGARGLRPGAVSTCVSMVTPPKGAGPRGSSLTPSPVPSPISPRPAPPVTTEANLICRDAWGARPARPGGRPHRITRLTLHHKAVVLGDNRNAPARFREDQSYHQDQLQWVDIAHHVGVDRNGNIYELRSTEIAGDTATDYDTTGHFLVLCEGDFDKETVTDAQLQGVAIVFAWAARRFDVATDTFAGHRDLAQTSCPGANLYAHLSLGDPEAAHRLFAGYWRRRPAAPLRARRIPAMTGIEAGD